jgi:hypothetical protein
MNTTVDMLQTLRANTGLDFSIELFETADALDKEHEAFQAEYAAKAAAREAQMAAMRARMAARAAN